MRQLAVAVNEGEIIDDSETSSMCRRQIRMTSSPRPVHGYTPLPPSLQLPRNHPAPFLPRKLMIFQIKELVPALLSKACLVQRVVQKTRYIDFLNLSRSYCSLLSLPDLNIMEQETKSETKLTDTSASVSKYKIGVLFLSFCVFGPII